ncbi:MAG: hypothetical protein HC866_24060 [Leptolyngbyaceae cyanobacterium RU_5_1]|nr:hypothetical protein [Leptolyngbyaceae cyanobacterium RU_5_1]
MIAVRFLVLLIVVPLVVQQVSKRFIVAPVLDRVRGEESAAQVFLNDEMKEEAFKELQAYEETLKFDALIHSIPPRSAEASGQPAAEKESSSAPSEASGQPPGEKGSGSAPSEEASGQPPEKPPGEGSSPPPSEPAANQALSDEDREKLVKQKAIEIAEEFRNKSKDAMSNVFADVIALGAFVLLLLVNREAVAVLKLFTDGVTQGLSDSAKAFILILLTDIFVGFHSPHGWEVLLEAVAGHLGIAASRTGIFFFIATVPVVLDTIFKYWLFRHLSRMAPTTLATYKEMND